MTRVPAGGELARDPGQPVTRLPGRCPSLPAQHARAGSARDIGAERGTPRQLLGGSAQNVLLGSVRRSKVVAVSPSLGV